MILLFDIGNTRTKIAQAMQHTIEFIQTIDSAKFIRTGAQFVPKSTDTCFVAKSHQTLSNAEIKSTLQNCTYTNVVFAQSQPRWGVLKNAYTDTTTLGIDRWLGMIYAWHTYQSAVAVLNLGTCITFDEIDDTGKHLGGIIALGRSKSHIHLCGLLHKNHPLSDIRTLGKKTENAIDAGNNQAFIATVEKLIKESRAEYVLISGGDALFAFNRLQTSSKKQLILVENITLNGLLIIANKSNNA